MPTYYATLRISRDKQDENSQRLGILQYANDNGITPLNFIADTASRSQPWTEREFGKLLLEKCVEGDVILAAEFSRLAGSPMQVFSIMETAAQKKVTIIITKNKLTIDTSLQGQIQAMVFGIASMIEVEFIRLRTREGLERARAEGRVGGRPAGKPGRLKLDGKLAEVGELHGYGLSAAKLAKRFDVTEKTMRKFLSRHFPKTPD